MISQLIARPPRSSSVLRARGPRRSGPPLRAVLVELFLIVLIAVAVVGAGWLSKRAVTDLLTRDPVSMPVPQKNSRTVKLPLLVVVAVDESSSMADSDPHDRRWADVASLGRWLKRYERATDRGAVIAFTTGATQSSIVPAAGLAVDPRGLAPGPAGGGTAFVPVVRAAREVFSMSGGAYYNVLILVTDGDAGDSAQAIAQLAPVANRVFIVALDRGGAWDHARERWERAGFPVTTIGNRAPNEIGAALARAVMQAAGQHA